MARDKLTNYEKTSWKEVIDIKSKNIFLTNYENIQIFFKLNTEIDQNLVFIKRRDK